MEGGVEEVYTRRVGNERGGGKLKGSKETLLGGKEERRRRGNKLAEEERKHPLRTRCLPEGIEKQWK